MKVLDKGNCKRTSVLPLFTPQLLKTSESLAKKSLNWGLIHPQSCLTFTPLDFQMMSRAIQLAKRGIYTTTQTRMWVVSSYKLMVGSLAKVFMQSWVKLMPKYTRWEWRVTRQRRDRLYRARTCSHYGRTPPCAEEVWLRLEVSKSDFCAMQDPVPLKSQAVVSRVLRDAGALRLKSAC